MNSCECTAAAYFPPYLQMLPIAIGAPMGVFPNGMVPMNPCAVFQHPFSFSQQNGMNYNNFQPQLAPHQPPIVINNNTTNYNINVNTVDLNASTQNAKGDVTVNRNTVTSNSQHSKRIPSKSLSNEALAKGFTKVSISKG